MKGFILAAGMGTRLKPWTDHHPKALVPVRGVPMLERVYNKMRDNGIENITINCHHFADQIIEFVEEKGWNANIVKEEPLLLETGGAILNAAPFLEGEEPILVHNVDILSDADFKALEKAYCYNSNDAVLLVSDRESSRKLIFDSDMRLKGWRNLKTDQYRPEGFKPNGEYKELGFSGIYVISPSIITEMKKKEWEGRFPIMDFFLSTLKSLKYYGHTQKNLTLLDIGKPEALVVVNK